MTDQWDHGLCHNDIRAPNITANKGRFCLIDYDNCSEMPSFGKSPVLKALRRVDVQSMMGSFIQNGLVVYWMENPKANIHAARKWIYRGEESCYLCDRAFMNLVLLRMLKLTSARRLHATPNAD